MRGLAAVVAPPHPLYGGRLDNPVVLVVAEALAHCGYAALRFNWRGVGRSEGRPSGRIEDALEDYRAALERARGGETGRVLAAGYSFGAAAAVKIACDEEDAVERLILVAPPAEMLEAIDVASIECPIHVIVGERDSFAPLARLTDIFARPPQARVDVVPDADHFFAYPFWLEKLGELVRARLV